MKTGQLYLNDQLLLPSVRCTENSLERMRGLLLRSQDFAGNGLIISPCNSVHSFFMTYSIDLVYLNKDFEVIKIYTNFAPWQMSACYGARHVLELPSDKVSRLNIKIGSSLIWKDI